MHVALSFHSNYSTLWSVARAAPATSFGPAWIAPVIVVVPVPSHFELSPQPRGPPSFRLLVLKSEFTTYILQYSISPT